MRLLSNSFKKDLSVILILFLLSCIFFWKILINPDKIIYSPWDLTWQFSFWKYFTSQSLDIYGELPLWNPYTFSGNPFVGNLLSALFYPINILYLVFPTDLIFGYIFLLDIFLAGLFTYFFMRTLELNRHNSFISAIIFMFSGSLVTRIYAGHINNLDVIIWTPLTFLLLERAIRKNSLFYGILTGIPMALQLLASHIQFAVYSFLGLSLYFLFRCAFLVKESSNLRQAIKPIKIFVIAFITGAILSSIQLLPSLELSKYSSRSDGISYDVATSFSLPPYYMITFILPEIFGSPLDHTSFGGAVNFIQFTAYLGVIPLILALFSVMFKRNRYTMIFLLLTIFTLLYSLGKYTPLYSFFYYLVPGFNMLKEPALILFMYNFSIAVLSGFGCDFLFGKLNKNKKRFYKFTKIIGIIIIIVIIGISVITFKKYEIVSFGEEIGKDRTLKKLKSDLIDQTVGDFYFKNMNKITEDAYSHIVNDLLVLLFSLLSIMFIIILRLKGSNFEFARILLILSILFTLWIFGMKYIIVKDLNEIYAKNDLVKFFEEDKSLYRVIGFNNTLPQYISGRYNIQITDGYDPTVLKRYLKILTIVSGQNYSETYNGLKSLQHPELLDILNTKYIITTEKMENEGFVLRSNLTVERLNHLHQIKYNQTNYIYENKNVLPRVFFVEGVKTIDEDKVLEEIKTNEFELKTYGIIEEKLNIEINGTVSKIEILDYSPNRVTLKTNSSGVSFLILSDVYYPGWKAYDNGKEIHIYQTDYILRGIVLTEGEHTIQFVYEPSSFKIGTIITLVGWFMLIVIIVLRFAHN